MLRCGIEMVNIGTSEVVFADGLEARPASHRNTANPCAE